MTEDRSLDEFVGGGADGDGESDDAEEERDVDEAGASADAEEERDVDEAGASVDAEEERDVDEAGESAGETGDEADADDVVDDPNEPNDPDAIDADPAVSTATWTTDGAACERCGESVARRWLDGDAVVCAACKEW